MTDRLNQLREAIRRPLPLAYHPLYRFYEGGSLTRRSAALPERPDDWWSEDWVGSCTAASNPDPDGRPQGLSLVELPGIGKVALRTSSRRCRRRWSGPPSPSAGGRSPACWSSCSRPPARCRVHAHPTRDWARQHLGSPFGKTEAWILLDAPGDGA